jgi:hypothetical protein
MKKFAISYMTFNENDIKMAIVNAESKQDALAQALNLSTGLEDFKSDEETLKTIAFNCDCLIGAIEIANSQD